MDILCFDGQPPVRKTGHTSKGDQLKWKAEDIWYKADYMGYEGLAETLISKLLGKSSLRYRFVRYEPVILTYRGVRHSGCASRDFLEPQQLLVPLEKLYRQNTGESLAAALAAFAEPAERIRFTAERVEDFTGLAGFGPYLAAILEIDAFFLNEDRHTNNMAVLYDTEKQNYALCPLFDQGLCLFADTTCDYPVGKSIEEFYGRIEAKPFSRDFDAQLDAAEELYGVQLRFAFTVKDIQRELDALEAFYPPQIRRRVEEILQWQMHKYAYLIQN